MLKKFDTPMFWNDDDLAELKGTTVLGWFSLYKLILQALNFFKVD